MNKTTLKNYFNTIKWLERLFLLFIPTHIVINDGVILYYKIYKNKLYIIKTEI